MCLHAFVLHGASLMKKTMGIVLDSSVSRSTAARLRHPRESPCLRPPWRQLDEEDDRRRPSELHPSTASIALGTRRALHRPRPPPLGASSTVWTKPCTGRASLRPRRPPLGASSTASTAPTRRASHCLQSPLLSASSAASMASSMRRALHGPCGHLCWTLCPPPRQHLVREERSLVRGHLCWACRPPPQLLLVREEHCIVRGHLCWACFSKAILQNR